MQVHNETEPEHSEFTQTAAHVATGQDPDFYEEAINLVDCDEWQTMMQAKMESIVSIGMYKLVPPLCDWKPIGCKWVYQIKHTPSGEIACHKVRLVAQGFSQKPGINFTKMFAPVVKTDSIHLLLAFTTAHDFEIHQVDIKSAFLIGKFEEVIYMCQLKGFIMKGKGTGSVNSTRPSTDYTSLAAFGIRSFETHYSNSASDPVWPTHASLSAWTM